MTEWRKSSFSGEDSNCVEIAFGAWRKSSYSGEDANCVELVYSGAAAMIRDSKNPDGPHLVLSSDSYRALVAQHR